MTNRNRSDGMQSPTSAQPNWAARAPLTDNAVALWRQLKWALRDMVLNSLKPGDRFPTEGELCARYGVSRTTVRQAMASLAAEGIVYSRQGSGTYVALPKVGDEIAAVNILSGIDESSQRAGWPVRIALLSTEITEADQRIQMRLKLPPHAAVYKIRRVKAVGGEPIAVQATYVPEGPFPGLTDTDFDRQSLGRLLRDRFGVRLSHVDASVECVVADEYRAKLLLTPPGAPLVLLSRTSVTQQGDPVIFSRIFFRHDRYRLTLRISLNQSGSEGAAESRASI